MTFFALCRIAELEGNTTMMFSTQTTNGRSWQREGAALASVYSFARVEKQGTEPKAIPATLCLDNHGPPGFPE